jgi:hypothetical protein
MNALIKVVSLDALVSISSNILAFQTIKVDLICFKDPEIVVCAKENVSSIMKRFKIDETQPVETS